MIIALAIMTLLFLLGLIWLLGNMAGYAEAKEEYEKVIDKYKVLIDEKTLPVTVNLNSPNIPAGQYTLERGTYNLNDYAEPGDDMLDALMRMAKKEGKYTKNEN